MLGLLNLSIGDIYPRKQAVEKEGKRILIHINLLPLWDLTTSLLIVLNVVEIDSLDSITEVILIYVGVSCQVEGNRNCLCLLNA